MASKTKLGGWRVDDGLLHINTVGEVEQRQASEDEEDRGQGQERGGKVGEEFGRDFAEMGRRDWGIETRRQQIRRSEDGRSFRELTA